jgi:hypothetical protein
MDVASHNITLALEVNILSNIISVVMGSKKLATQRKLSLPLA